jgi:porphobilinogen synthase
MGFPVQRLRRLRAHPTLRRMVRETLVTPDDLIAPLFVHGQSEGESVEISSMPGQSRWSPQAAAREAKALWELGIPAVILFGIVPQEEKDAVGSAAYDADGPVARAIREIKNLVPQMCVIADVCACEYTNHGHCGILDGEKVTNDPTLELLNQAALCYARAGVDIVAPSDMMDGRVASIRATLDAHEYSCLPIMSYAAKFAGAFYGPFREAASSAPSFGDRRSYQMDIANRLEAKREVASDIQEGADIILIKPALFCLDLIRDAREACDLPICAYNVSSEYAMIKAAGERGWIDEARLVDETLTSIKRAGADLIISYHAREWAQKA